MRTGSSPVTFSEFFARKQQTIGADAARLEKDPERRALLQIIEADNAAYMADGLDRGFGFQVQMNRVAPVALSCAITICIAFVIQLFGSHLWTAHHSENEMSARRSVVAIERTPALYLNPRKRTWNNPSRSAVAEDLGDGPIIPHPAGYTDWESFAASGTLGIDLPKTQRSF